MSTNISTQIQNQTLLTQITNIQKQLQQAQNQVVSGKKAQTYSGLRDAAQVSLNLNNTKTTIDTYKNTIAVTQVRMETTQHALNRVADIATEIRNAARVASTPAGLPAATGNGALKAEAQARLAEVLALLNSQVDGAYLFAGRQTDVRPFTAPGAIGTAGTPLDNVAILDGAFPLTNTASGTARYNAIASELAAPASSAPAYYYNGETGAAPNLSARIDAGLDLEYGIRGDTSGFKAVLRGLYALATTDLNATTDAGFREVARLAADDLDAGFKQIVADGSKLGIKQATIKDIAGRHDDFLTLLQTQISDVEDVDMAASATRLTALQTNLEASYRVLASLKNLSLANFL